MKAGDKCKYKDYDIQTHAWKEGIILDIRGPFSARVYVVAGTGHSTGELKTRTGHYIMKTGK